MSDEQKTAKIPVVAGSLAIVLLGWISECLVRVIRYGSAEDGAVCFGFPFWTLAFLWAKIPSKVALAISAPITFGIVSTIHWKIALRDDPQNAIAFGILYVFVVPVVSAVAYAFGLLIHPPSRRP